MEKKEYSVVEFIQYLKDKPYIKAILYVEHFKFNLNYQINEK